MDIKQQISTLKMAESTDVQAFVNISNDWFQEKLVWIFEISIDYDVKI